MTEDEWAAAEEDAIWAAISPLSSRRQRLLAVALVRSLGLWEGDVVAAAMDACERFADTGKTKAALKRARVALSDSRVLLANLASGPQDRTTSAPVGGNTPVTSRTKTRSRVTAVA
jgi:hypothetical protein